MYRMISKGNTAEYLLGPWAHNLRMMQDQGVRTFGGTAAEIVCRGATSGPGGQVDSEELRPLRLQVASACDSHSEGKLELEGYPRIQSSRHWSPLVPERNYQYQ